MISGLSSSAYLRRVAAYRLGAITSFVRLTKVRCQCLWPKVGLKHKLLMAPPLNKHEAALGGMEPRDASEAEDLDPRLGVNTSYSSLMREVQDCLN